MVEIQTANDIDYDAYAAFQRRAFRDLLERQRATDDHMTAEYYRWKYRPPSGAGRVARVVADGVTLSSSAIFPLRVSCCGRSVTAWQYVDVATVPEARRRGLLTATLRRLADGVADDEILYGFPNAGSLGAFAALGFAEHGVVTTWASPEVRLVARRHDRIGPVDRFGPEHDLAGRCAGGDGPMVDRGHDYLNWRYADHPIHDYALLAYEDNGCRGICIVRSASIMGRDLALVMELLGTEPQVLTALLSHASDWARGSGLAAIALMTTALPLRTAVRVLLVPIPSRLLRKRQVLILRAGDRVPSVMTTRGWAVQTGDWDVF